MNRILRLHLDLYILTVLLCRRMIRHEDIDDGPLTSKCHKADSSSLNVTFYRIKLYLLFDNRSVAAIVVVYRAIYSSIPAAKLFQDQRRDTRKMDSI